MSVVIPAFAGIYRTGNRFARLSSLPFSEQPMCMFSFMDGFRYKTGRTDNTVHVWMIRAGRLQHANVHLDDPDDFRNMIQKIILFIN